MAFWFDLQLDDEEELSTSPYAPPHPPTTPAAPAGFASNASPLAGVRGTCIAPQIERKPRRQDESQRPPRSALCPTESLPNNTQVRRQGADVAAGGAVL
jgi:hypothetical protein